MVIRESLSEKFYKCENIYDLACVLYVYLYRTVVHQPLFLDTYIFPGSSNTLQGRDQSLVLKLPSEFVRLFERRNYVVQPVLLDHFIMDILSSIQRINFCTHLEQETEAAVVCFCLLRGIDSGIDLFFKKKSLESFFCRTLGPLNYNSGETDAAVYLQYLPSGKHAVNPIDPKDIDDMEERRRLIDTVDYPEERKKYRTFLRTVPQQYDLAAQLTILLFICRETLKFDSGLPYASFPHTVILDGQQKLSGKDRTIITAAVSPVSCNGYFEKSGNTVVYSEKNTATLKELHTKLLQEMLKYSPNLIILPELSVPPEVRDTVFATLHGSDSLICIFAGSTETDDGNNVMSIFTTDGLEIGRYYKYAPYQSDNFREQLNNPGKEITLVYVNNLVGYFLPSICRDSFDNAAKTLVTLFKPLMTCIAAYSESVAPFKNAAQSFAEAAHTSFVLCNSCNALTPDKRIIGYATVPCMDNSRITIDCRDIERTDDCCTACRNRAQSCIYLLTYDLSFPHINRKSVLTVEKKSVAL
jgi:hypothetical protein